MPDMWTNHFCQNFSAKHLIQYTKEWFICKWSGSWVGIIESALWRGRLITNSNFLICSPLKALVCLENSKNVAFDHILSISFMKPQSPFFITAWSYKYSSKVLPLGSTKEWKSYGLEQHDKVNNASFCILFDSALDAQMQWSVEWFPPVFTNFTSPWHITAHHTKGQASLTFMLSIAGLNLDAVYVNQAWLKIYSPTKFGF